MVAEAGAEDFERYAARISDGAGVPGLIRRLVGLEPDAVRAEFADYLDGFTLTANQIGFTRKLVDVICDQGGIEISAIFESPFDQYPVRDLFETAQLIDISDRINRINGSASAG